MEINCDCKDCASHEPTGHTELVISSDYINIRKRLERSTALEIVRGFAYDTANPDANDVVARTSDRTVIDHAVSAIRFTDEARMDWMERGSPTLAFLEGNIVLLTVECMLPRYVRSMEGWPGDAVLENDGDLTDFLMSLAVISAGESLDSGQSLNEVAAALRRDYRFSPVSTIRVLHSAGVSLSASKPAVDLTLNEIERHNTDALREGAITALDLDDP